jgi:hypothetical protein
LIDLLILKAHHNSNVYRLMLALKHHPVLHNGLYGDGEGAEFRGDEDGRLGRR